MWHSFPVTPAENRYLLVAIDYFTKWPEMYPMADQLVGSWVSQSGIPVELHSHEGRNFESYGFQEARKLMVIWKSLIWLYGSILSRMGSFSISTDFWEARQCHSTKGIVILNAISGISICYLKISLLSPAEKYSRDLRHPKIFLKLLQEEKEPSEVRCWGGEPVKRYS